jgi:cysteine desulfurase
MPMVRQTAYFAAAKRSDPDPGGRKNHDGNGGFGLSGVASGYITGVMPTQIDGSIFYSGKEVAAACGVSRQTIWRWRQDGLIPEGRPRRGGTVVFTEAELEYIRARISQGIPSETGAPAEIYLDNAASTRPIASVRNAVARAMGVEFGNPSSAHGAGRRSRQAVEDAREQVAALVGADRSHVVFTSGGTEANNLLLHHAHAAGIRRVVTTQVEHSSILGGMDALVRAGIEVHILPVAPHGRVCLDSFSGIPVDERTLVSVQWANNETGVVQPILDLAGAVKRRGGFIHTDAAQAAGKLTIDFASSPIDALTLTAHKIHGPQGIGALVTKSTGWVQPIFLGGSQERGLRVGTENYPGIVGFGVAAEHRLATLRTFVRHSKSLRDMFEARLSQELAEVRFNGAATDRVCTTGSATIDGIDGQALIAQLDARGIRMSQSSACTNMRPEPSYVLRAMGLSEDAAYSTIRYAMSEDTTFEACNRAADAIVEIAIRLGALPARRTPVMNDKEVA